MRTYQPHANDQITAAQDDLTQRVNARVAELVAGWVERQGMPVSAQVEAMYVDQAWRELA